MVYMIFTVGIWDLGSALKCLKLEVR